MSGKEGKRLKGRRNLYSHSNHTSANAPTTTADSDGLSPSSFQSLWVDVKMSVGDVATEPGHPQKPSFDDAERITELMDAPVELDIPLHAINKASNPYLDRCMYCNTYRTPTQDGDEGLELLDLQLPGNSVINGTSNSQSFSSLKLEMWTCARCRKVAGNFQSFLEANFPQATYDLPFVHDKTCIDPLPCDRCHDECDVIEKESLELKENWIELHTSVKNLYNSEEPVLSQEQGDRLKFLVDKLCNQDPHQLFLRLESQVRDIMVEIKTSLLVKLKENGIATPELALDFTSSLLAHYDQLTKKAHLFAQYLGGLTEHLLRFKVTWELLNKHLFHSIAHNDPVISNSGPSILEQLRHGSSQYERSRDDPFCSVRKHLLRFQDEMSEVVMVWRDCQQLIESYCQEEVKNTQKQVSSKAWSFISQQRQFLKKQLMQEPLTDEALSETMRNLMSGHKSSTERVLCPNCMRKRCTCDECTITHMITCGIINSDKGEIPPLPSSFNFSLDHAQNFMNITPPSLSSTTSSSGSISPLNIEDKLPTFYDCERVLKDFSDALLGCDGRQVGTSGLNGDSNNDDVDENAGDDEDEDDDVVDGNDFPNSQDAGGDEPHSLQIPICELKDADVFWEAVQHHQQQVLQQQQLLKNSQHSCAHCKQAKHGQQCPQFQQGTNADLSRQFDIELTKSDQLPGEAGDCGMVAATNGGNAADDSGSGDSGGMVSSGVCAACQCHACLKQSGHIVSTSLPLQIPVSPPPAELHLYPHIHGLLQQHQQQYLLDLPPPLLPPIKFPVKLDFDDNGGIQNHLSYAYSDWENTLQPRPGSLAAQHHHQHHQRLSALNSDLLPPPPLVTSASPFTFDLASHLATHTMHTSTTNTSMFKSVAGKPLASSILPTLNSVSQMASEGSSVDPSKPLDFTTHSKITHSCMNLTSSVPSTLCSPHSCSCPSFISTHPTTAPGVTTSSATSSSCGSCHGSSCSRPVPIGGNVSSSKWERNQHCRKFNSVNKSVAGVQSQHSQHNIGLSPLPNCSQGSPSACTPAALKNLNFTSKHNTQSCSHSLPSRPSVLPSSPGPDMITSNSVSIATSVGTSLSLPCGNNSALVNNIGVGTSTPCNGPDYDIHHNDDNCDSIDDSCSEKSSSTSTSNQKEGKYCDCCYCEFFGHNNTQVAKISTNYIEMKDRLRKKLKKRQSESKHKQEEPKNEPILEGHKEELDPLEKKGLDGLLNFINGTEKECQGKSRDKELTAKAAKRARQKQKKLEEKARQVQSASPAGKHHHHPETSKSQEQPVLNQTWNHTTEYDLNTKLKMAKSKSKKTQPVSWTNNLLNGVGLSVSGPSLMRQDFNRSSLIIESTRPTISRSSTSPSSCTTSQQMLGIHSESQQMTQFLNSLQHQHQQNTIQPTSPLSAKDKKMHVSQAKGSGIIEAVPSTKVSNDAIKTNGVSKLQQNDGERPSLQQQQQSAAKSLNGKLMNGKVSVNGKVSTNGKVASSSQLQTRSNHVTVSGQNISIYNPHLDVHANGKSSKSVLQPAVPTVPAASVSEATITMKSCLIDSPSAGSSSSASQSPSCGTKPILDQGKTNGKTKKNKKKNKNGHECGVDEIFMPKSQSELDGDVDDFERELEEFKRFCFEPAEPRERRKISVNVNLKDIFKKKTGIM